MKISYNWLKQFLQLDWEAEKTAELLTNLGLEVEGIQTFESIKGNLEGVIVGKVLTCEQHPNADRLKVTTVDIGAAAILQIVCGAPNVAVGQTVLVATIDTTLYMENGESLQIKKGKIRGEDSFGMICAEDELGLGKDHDGILVLDNKFEVGTLASKVFNISSDQVFEIGLTPNRADAMSHMGVARDLRAGLMQEGLKLEFKTPSVSNFQVDERTLKIDLQVDDKELIPRYCGVTIDNIKVETSPKWLQDRLKAIGLSPKNNIVDITNYILHELGQPLHAFDAAKIKGNKIIVKTLKSDTPFITLDGIERKLHAEDIMICDGEENPLCIGGVFGGMGSGVSENTTSIFLESAYFNPIAIRKTAKRHALNTDASFRFERGIDPSITKYALKRASILIKEICGGKISSEIVEFHPQKAADFQVFLNYENANKLIGQKLPKETIKNIIASLEIKILNENEVGLGLMVPPYRVDVQREADVIEEIIRVYGYNNIEFSDKLNMSLSFSEFDELKVENIIASQLTAQGFNEIMSNSLTKPEYISLTDSLNEAHNVTIINPLSADLGVMRQSLLYSGLESIAYNINRKNNTLKFFEFGKTYHKFDSGYHEQKHFSLIITGSRMPESWLIGSKLSDFFFLKGIIKSILNRLGIDNIKTSTAKSDIFTEAIIFSSQKKKIVEFGVVNPVTLKYFDIKQEVLFADINWDVLLELSQNQTVKVKNLPKFPSVKRDLALLLDATVTFDEIYQLAYQSERNLLKEVNLFDVYQGKNLPENKKSYAVSFLLQDETKTLTDLQIEKTMSKLLQTFEEELGASLRQ
ncbi:MAG: phenylalanine--tRNA ligase subunit beta [Flavobacteriaceae bacterium]|nr:phenylalanine--tRNA ligase subunit beta [Flavobacteriaceae bacterium]